MAIEHQFAALKDRMFKERPNLSASAGKVSVLFGLVFPWIVGIVFVVVPMVQLALNHLYRHIVVPTERWLYSEPTFGNQLMFSLSICALACVLWLVRNWLGLLLLGAISGLKGLMKRIKSKPSGAALSPDSREPSSHA